MALHHRFGRVSAVMLVAALTTGVAVASASPALAYSGSAAAQYADTYATSPNNGTYPVFTADCTNFVSQALHAGGYPFRQYGTNSTGSDAWWVINHGNDSFSWALNWSVANDLYHFLIDDVPGGVTEGTAPGSSTNDYTPNAMVTGDVLFYDWGQGEGISHAAIQVGIGTDPNMYPNQVWYGNYVDEHTSYRGHAFWSLKPYNAYWATTTIYFMHVLSSN